jgi:hypothetical protein
MILWEINLKKTMGRLAGAVLAGALITLAVSPAAMAQTVDPTPPTTTSEVSATSTPSSGPATSSTPSSGPATTSESTATGVPSTQTSEPTTSGAAPTGQPTTGKPPETSKPTGSKPIETTSATATTPQEPPYQDNTAYGIDLANGQGLLVIACAAGQPTGVSSADFDLMEGPHQDGTDGRYWGWLVKFHEGSSFATGNVQVDWKCGADKPVQTPVKPGGGAGAGAPGVSKDGKSQVKYAPKGGIETGFGGTAQA